MEHHSFKMGCRSTLGRPITENVCPKLSEDFPPIEQEVSVSIPESQAAPLGRVINIMGSMVIVAQFTKFMRPLSFDTVLFLRNGKRALGKICDIFGPVAIPHYVVAFPNVESLQNTGVSLQDIAYFAPNVENLTFYIDQSILSGRHKGTDATGFNDVPIGSDIESESDEENNEKSGVLTVCERMRTVKQEEVNVKRVYYKNYNEFCKEMVDIQITSSASENVAKVEKGAEEKYRIPDSKELPLEKAWNAEENNSISNSKSSLSDKQSNMEENRNILDSKGNISCEKPPPLIIPSPSSSPKIHLTKSIFYPGPYFIHPVEIIAGVSIPEPNRPIATPSSKGGFYITPSPGMARQLLSSTRGSIPTYYVEKISWFGNFPGFDFSVKSEDSQKISHPVDMVACGLKDGNEVVAPPDNTKLPCECSILPEGVFLPDDALISHEGE